ncbi:carbamate kinase [Desulfitibacter alkalitolerans]|uniref:carbamate kinase n=1 Tax=Desulfitibacter alkalitolerans TaxID=264641 RepID=UPI0004830B55|nr:carbamate kinase [Desulfitibacter alkalitolerans]
MGSTVVVALGGNAILQPKQKGTFQEQMTNVEKTCEHIVKLIKEGYKVIITHGNGPQVGNILVQHMEARHKVPAMPLFACGAESQGFIGYMIAQAMTNTLSKEGIDKQVCTILTRVLVDKDDPAFENPTKPVGAFLTKQEAEEIMAQTGEKWIEDSGRGWRKVVYSPKPKKIVELPVIKALVNQGNIVIAGGGGGIPVIEENGMLKGVEAVIDKDRAGSLMAQQMGAHLFMILTDVPQVAVNFGTPEQKNLDVLTTEQAKQYLKEGQFGSGSMGPKVEAAVAFVERGGSSVIASLEYLLEAVEGKSGTRFIKK